MLRSMTWTMLVDWVTYYGVEPWGEERKDLRTDFLAAAILAPHLKKGERAPQLSGAIGGVVRPRQSIEEMQSVVAGIQARHAKAREKKHGSDVSRKSPN